MKGKDTRHLRPYLLYKGVPVANLARGFAWKIRLPIVLFVFLCGCLSPAQSPPARKQLLVIGEQKGYRHEAVSHAMATIERMGRESGLWDTTLRTDTEALTKKKLEYNAKNLNDFDAVVFFTGGELEMDAQQKADFLSFIHEDGKGFVGVHSATITFTTWPEYGEMISMASVGPPSTPRSRTIGKCASSTYIRSGTTTVMSERIASNGESKSSP